MDSVDLVVGRRERVQLTADGSSPGGAAPVLIRWRRILRTWWGSVMTGRTRMGEPQRLQEFDQEICRGEQARVGPEVRIGLHWVAGGGVRECEAGSVATLRGERPESLLPEVRIEAERISETGPPSSPRSSRSRRDSASAGRTPGGRARPNGGLLHRPRSSGSPAEGPRSACSRHPCPSDPVQAPPLPGPRSWS